MPQKKQIIIGAVIVILLGSGFLLIQFYRSSNGKKAPAASTGSQATSTSYALYDGTFISYDKPIMVVKLSGSNLTGGFIINERTAIGHKGEREPAVASQSRRAPPKLVPKKISDIPKNARVEIVVPGTDGKTPASQVIYGP